MVAVTEGWLGWVLVRARFLVLRIRQLELLDRAYTLAAQSFVTLLPLIIIIAAALSAPGRASVVAEQFIARFGLVGAAARAVEDLIFTSFSCYKVARARVPSHDAWIVIVAMMKGRR